MLPIRQTTCLAQNNPILPQRIFADGTQGVLYDPTDFTTIFQDSAGTTPVTALEQPVGLMLDKSKGLVLGSELVTNGTFDTDSGWTKGTGWAISGGAATCIASGINTAIIQTGVLASVIGTFYKIQYTVISNTLSGGSLHIGAYSGSSYFTAYTALPSSVGTQIVYLQATKIGTALDLWISTLSTSGSITIDNISVREIAGNHAYQATSGNRPTLTARYNMLTNTEDFSNAAWVKPGLNISSGFAATDGSNSAFKITETSANSEHLLYQSIAGTNGVSYTYRFIAKNAGYSIVRITSFAEPTTAIFNLSTGIATGGGGSMVALGDGWYLCSYTVSKTNGNASFFIALSSYGVFTGDTSKSIYFWHPDLRVADDGVGLPAYQRVTSSSDYDTAGFPPRVYYNGVNMYLMTNNIDFSSTDKMFVCVGLRKLVEGASRVALELSINTNVYNGTFYISAPTAYELNSFAFVSKGTTANSASVANSLPTSTTAVITGIASISTPVNTTRKNGFQISTTSSTQGLGNYGNHPFYIGARVADSLYFSGYMGPIVIAGKTLTDRQVTDTETWVNSKTKAFV